MAAAGKEPSKTVVSFLSGDSYSPGVLSARAGGESGAAYSGVNGLRSGSALPHMGENGLSGGAGGAGGAGRAGGAAMNSIKPRFDGGAGR